MKNRSREGAVLLHLSPLSAEVTSDNIVGYKKVELGVNAQDILGQIFVTKDMSIQDIRVDGDFSTTGSDYIMWWNAETRSYSTALYFGEEVDGVFDPSDADYENPLGAGWGDNDQYLVDGVIPAGKGFWSQAYDGGQLLFAGEVTTDGTVTLGANSMDLVCNPFPVDTDIQDIVPAGNFSTSGSDYIMWWNAETRSYTTALYFGEDVDGVFDPADADYENPLGAGWGDNDQYKVDGVIPAGHGFWAQAYDGGVLTFKNPVVAE